MGLSIEPEEDRGGLGVNRKWAELQQNYDEGYELGFTRVHRSGIGSILSNLRLLGKAADIVALVLVELYFVHDPVDEHETYAALLFGLNNIRQ